MNVVLYLRYSSDKQNEQSIEGQMRVCKEFCRHKGYTIINTYIDRATSALRHIEKRISFLQMIKDSEKRRFEAVVVYKLDRFARDRHDSATYKYKLKKNGVRVISATENISETPEGIILESVLEGMAEFYSKELSQKVIRGMRETALKGNSNGCGLSLGYKVKDHKYVIDRTTAPIVVEAFKRFAAGETVADICRSFNERGYRTKKGNKFNKNSFRCIFGNRKYIGEYRYGDIVIPGGMPAIVDEETFNAVEERLKRNELAPRKGRTIVDYLLSQKMFCGHCGALMIGVSSTSHTGKKYHYYACSNNKSHKCEKRPMSKSSVEKAVAEDVINLLTPKAIEKIADIAVAEANKENSDNTLIPALQQEIADYERSIKRLLTLVERGSDSPSLFARLEELENSKKIASKRLEVENKCSIQINKKFTIYILSKFIAGNPEDFDTQRRVIDMLVRNVIVWDTPDGGYKFTYMCNLDDKNHGDVKFNSDDLKNICELSKGKNELLQNRGKTHPTCDAEGASDSVMVTPTGLEPMFSP